MGVENGTIKVISNIHDKKKSTLLTNYISLNPQEYVLSPKERLYIILLELFFSKDFITIKYLANKLVVSRNTIVNDLNKVKQWLINHQINPAFIPGKGLAIDGDEKYIRRAILQIFRETIPLEQYLKLIQNNFSYSSNSKDYFNVVCYIFDNDDDIEKIKDYIGSIQKRLGIVFSDLVYIELIICLAINIKRIKLGKNIHVPKSEKQQILNTKVYKMVNLLSNSIDKQFNIDYNVNEMVYFAKLILASNTITIPTIENYPNKKESQTFTNKLIQKVSIRLNYDFTKDNNLYEQLCNFIVPFMYRQKHDILIYNPYLKEIKTKYANIFANIKAILLDLECDFEKNIIDDEIGYITLYFAASLENNDKFNILIVSETGFSTANLLAAKLKSLFNVNIVDLIPINELPNKLDKYNVDMIVSTSHIHSDLGIGEDVPCIVVDPILTQENILSFRQYINTKYCKTKKK